MLQANHVWQAIVWIGEINLDGTGWDENRSFSYVNQSRIRIDLEIIGLHDAENEQDQAWRLRVEVRGWESTEAFFFRSPNHSDDDSDDPVRNALEAELNNVADRLSLDHAMLSSALLYPPDELGDHGDTWLFSHSEGGTADFSSDGDAEAQVLDALDSAWVVFTRVDHEDDIFEQSTDRSSWMEFSDHIASDPDESDSSNGLCILIPFE